MVESWDGTLSSAEFYVAACAFAEQWRKFNSSLPHWSWAPSRKRPWISNHNHQVGYLCLENVKLSEVGLTEAYKEGDVIEKEECVSEYEDEVVDAAAVVHHNGGPGVHCYDFHAVYSASYRVPVLYFRAYCNDGQPLHLDEIEKDIPVNSTQLLSKSKWTFMTQEEHPELNRPWYTLHPCGTSEWMKLLLSSDVLIAQGRIPVETKYIISWFSVVGQVFGLKLSSEMMNFDGSDSSVNL
ncbi:ubiquitin-like-conjugating enzyme atg10 [Phtheirospermum japonicum]|uniref:Ubiquitin-like-conjugating enzyme ATG10 n=1 Tax=Phtheirospermum japonicum TaxID=374723 RepID=A0A830BXJ0_9LAMI|nr:ubiquitin-like-conjugating enzyme atg10 [Phtheirospermum japonicum]